MRMEMTDVCGPAVERFFIFAVLGLIIWDQVLFYLVSLLKG